MSVVRWGVLSTARIGREKVIPAIQRAEGCEVVALASRSREVGEETAAALGIGRVHGGYADLLADPDVDAVYIPLPNHLHAEWTIAAAGAGKHVLCEKPLALTAADARDMVDACAAAGVKFMEAFMYRHHPSWEAVRRLVAEGRIGEPAAVQSWFSYYNDDPADIRNIAAFGGGALMDIGCYPVNLSRMLFAAEPDRVSAAVVRDANSRVDVLTSAILHFGDRQATFTCSTRAEPDQRVHIVGTRGRIDIEIPFNIPPDRTTRVYVAAGGDPPADPNVETVTLPPADQYTVQAELFARAILEDGPVPTPPEDGVANMAVIEQIFAAAQ